MLAAPMKLVALSIAASAAACGARTMPPSLDHPLAGALAPPFEAATMQETDVEVPSKSPRLRATLIDFWASWCDECTRTMPQIEAIWRDRKDDGLQVIGVSLDESEDAAASAASSLGATFPIVFDPRMGVGGRYRVGAIPLAFVVDRGGTVRFVGRDPASLRRAVDAVLAE